MYLIAAKKKKKGADLENIKRKKTHTQYNT